MLRRSPPPNPSYSLKTLADIEALVTDSEIPPYFKHEEIPDWTVYLRLRSMALLRGNAPDTGHKPDSTFGEWQPLT
ncbi:hypothetical protein [Lignipirellula cremea]|nr:hypothetical protein [Lignipirellula cremea]